VFEIIVTILGIAVSALFAGYLAYAIKSVPLTIIVIATFVLVARQFVVEFRNTGERKAKNGRGR
jgi:hypothetical protein